MTTSEIFNNILMVIGAIALSLLITVFLWKILDEISDRSKLKQQILKAQDNLDKHQKERFECICLDVKTCNQMIEILHNQIELLIESDRSQDKMIIHLQEQLYAYTNNRDNNNNG